MQQAETHGASACDGCSRRPLVLRVVDDAKLCDSCVECGLLIDQRLVDVHTSDPVNCDGCRDHVEFDARVAVVVRACGGVVLCDRCTPAAMERAAS